MLERVSACLKSGKFKIFEACIRNSRSQRMLHSFFWHHGAQDLTLPACWACSDLFREDGDITGTGRWTKLVGKNHPPDAPFLDFLYPSKAYGFLQRLCLHNSRLITAHGVSNSTVGKRQYTTSKRSKQNYTIANGLKQPTEEAQSETARDDLIQLIIAKPDHKQEDAWRLYDLVPGKERTSELVIPLLSYLELGNFERLASRILLLFSSIPDVERTLTSFCIAIRAHLTIGELEESMKLHGEAAQRFDSLEIGTNILLKYTVGHRQWRHALRVVETAQSQVTRLKNPMEKWLLRRERYLFDAIWGQAALLPNGIGNVKSLLGFIRESGKERNATPEKRATFGLLLKGYASAVVSEALRDSASDEHLVWNFLIYLIQNLRALRLPFAELTEHGILEILQLPQYREYTTERKLWFNLYGRYRSLTTDGRGTTPSRYLITRLINQFVELDSALRVEEMVSDLRKYHSDPFTPHCLYTLIHYYAKAGDVKAMHKYFDELHKTYPKDVDLAIIASLPYGYARRIDIPGTITQFKRISAEFRLVPDTACWNILLLAYARADDLDGALQCFNNCVESGNQPDIYTFTTMLDLCATRGDIESFENLFHRAKRLKIPLDVSMHARASYVTAFINAGDIECAEAIAQNILQDWRSGHLQGDSLTHVWNVLITFYALKGDLNNTRRIHRQMADLDIPPDTWTYAALMRALIEVGEPAPAFKILQKTMPANNIRPHAFHYAIAIRGFLGTGQIKLAQGAYKIMKQRELPQTTASRQAALINTGVQELMRLKAQSIHDPRQRLEAVEEQIRQSLLADYGVELARQQPSHNKFIDSPELSNIPQGYFALLIMLYNTRKAFEICKQLFEAASKNKTNLDDYQGPIALLVAIMDTHYRAAEYADVEKCWKYVRRAAEPLTRTLQKFLPPEESESAPYTVADVNVKEQHDSALIAVNRRQILFRATRIYLRSLVDRQDPDAIMQAQRTMRDLLSNGFIVDNMTWNEFIRGLARRGRIYDAFASCEMWMMPQFPGWRTLNVNYVRKDRIGHPYMELRHHDITKTSLLPRYKTFLILAAAYSRVLKDESIGLGFDHETGSWIREDLDRVAPLTIKAIDEMPQTGDALQRRYLWDLYH